MKLGNFWIARIAALAMVVLVGIVVMTAADTTPEITTGSLVGAPAALAPDDDCRLEDPAADRGADFLLEQEGGSLEPTAICRLLPQCSSNSDCDAKCGVGLGKCVHSNCPVRICRCR